MPDYNVPTHGCLLNVMLQSSMYAEMEGFSVVTRPSSFNGSRPKDGRAWHCSYMNMDSSQLIMVHTVVMIHSFHNISRVFER